MKIYEIDGKRYHLPNNLTSFQLKMYVHLINWKWDNITHKPGYNNGILYDAFFPDELEEKLFPLYPPLKERFLEHQIKFSFKYHNYFRHMASSQAACVNLFLPILKDPNVATKILGKVKKDLNEIAVDFLDAGFRMEFWDEPDNLLNDHRGASGTDSDIAIAYYDKQNNLNLWMIEHKLTEREFTPCRGARSNGRTASHICSPTSNVLDNLDLCYYHSNKKYNYWDITLSDYSPFNINLIREYKICPFKGGMNQLWRNQLLGAGLESSSSLNWPFKKVYFSVVYHPGNNSLEHSIFKYHELLKFKDRFFTFSSDKLINKAKEINEPEINEWLKWYEGLYYI